MEIVEIEHVRSVPYLPSETWKYHDSYRVKGSYSRIVTRSQTAFHRLDNNEDDLMLFADPIYYFCEGKPHLAEYLKGPYGSLPRTVITKSTGVNLSRTDELCEGLKEYEQFTHEVKIPGAVEAVLPEPEVKELTEEEKREREEEEKEREFEESERADDTWMEPEVTERLTEFSDDEIESEELEFSDDEWGEEKSE